MRKFLALLLVLTLCGCAAPVQPTTVPPTTVPPTTVPETTVPETTVPETTVPETTVPETTAPESLVLEGCSLDDLLVYWDEVVLQMEYTDGTGDPSLVQKWLYPIRYRITGDPTEEDLAVLDTFFAQLNAIPGFPGIREAGMLELENLSLNFLEPEKFKKQFRDIIQGEDAWGAAQFWYSTETNELNSGQIGYRTDIDQIYRDSILLEEIVNVLGITDTVLREDSIVYQYSNSNLALSDVDLLILTLLYHPDIHHGMNAEECHAVLAELYQ